MASENCTKCRKKISENDLRIKCSGVCHNYFHLKCINITDSQLEVIENCKGVKWFCNNCDVYTKLMSKLTTDMDALKNYIQTELNEIKSIVKLNTNDTKITKTKTFADVVSEEVVIIKPKNNQESKKTKEAIQKNLKPATLEVGISEVRNIKEGGVVIKCKSKEEQEIIKKAAEKKMNKNYDIRAPNLKNPSIKITGIEDKIGGDELINLIFKQNSSILHDNSEISVKTVKKMKTRYMAIVECDPETYKNIMEQNYLCIDWAKCRVYDYVSVYRCFKCGSFDHHVDNCKSQNRCLNCTSSDHTTENCKVDSFTCNNCLEMKEKMKIDIDPSHFIYDINCPVYLRKVEM